jgi:hypothetical protein
MKLSKIKPCAACGGPLMNSPIGNWFVLRVSTAMLNPQRARETLGMMQFFGGALGLAEAFVPEPEKAIAIVGDLPGATWTELHLCLDCYCSLGNLVGLVENASKEGGPPA